MLVLIAGITGTFGHPLAEAALGRGYAVRGLGRTPEKLEKSISARLETFVVMESMYDMAALDKAVDGVDAVVCAYAAVPEVIIEGQLLLLRAAERAGVKIFHAASWNYDWTRNALGDHETYDCFIAFANHVRLSSAKIRPLYAMTGSMTEYVFIVCGGGGGGGDNGLLDSRAGTVSFFGTGDEQTIYTTGRDLAEYAMEAISDSRRAEEGGVYRVESFRASPREVARAYEEVRGPEVKLREVCKGSLADVERLLAEARSSRDAVDHEAYIGLAYDKYMLDGTWDVECPDVKRWPGVRQTSLREWFLEHPQV